MTLDHQQAREIFLVDDDEDFRALVRLWLGREGYRVRDFVRADRCMGVLERGSTPPSMILLDITLPGMSGRDALTRIVEQFPSIPVIMLTANRESQTMAELIGRGAYDYITKPLDPDRLLTTIRNAIERHDIRQRLAAMEEGPTDELEGMVGASPEMRALSWQVKRIATTDVSVLIHGESGTGKELVAQAIHRRSQRRSGPFIALNCAAIPESLQDTELFGHERGSFTGATTRYIGRFEQASRGTLFLDEVAELSPSVQSRLLRVLQERRIRRLGGGAEEHPVDFRLITASHAHLRSAVTAGRFREDLYFRLAVYELEVPPLRDRTGDIPVLVRHFVKHYADELGKGQVSVSPEAMAMLERHAWPGNVRELQNAVQRAMVSCVGGTLLPSDLPRSVLATRSAHPQSTPPPLPAGHLLLEPGLTLSDVERRVIVWSLERANGNVSEASRELGVARTTLYRKMKAYSLEGA